PAFLRVPELYQSFFPVRSALPSGSDVPKLYQMFWRSFSVNLFTAFDLENTTRLSGVLCA
ncbi:hypothetical protein, partial [Cellulomonas sp. Y8]|uniref:hypothetical protein n=1 Tax=Cellulomonas sp. Y8 TaxID=2591145 RepID=UPI003D70530A